MIVIGMVGICAYWQLRFRLVDGYMAGGQLVPLYFSPTHTIRVTVPLLRSLLDLAIAGDQPY